MSQKVATTSACITSIALIGMSLSSLLHDQAVRVAPVKDISFRFTTTTKAFLVSFKLIVNLQQTQAESNMDVIHWLLVSSTTFSLLVSMLITWQKNPRRADFRGHQKEGAAIHSKS